MESITVSELRRNTRPYLARVAAGETIAVTRRGVPVAALKPPRVTLYERLVLTGDLVPPTAPWDSLFSEDPDAPGVS